MYIVSGLPNCVVAAIGKHYGADGGGDESSTPHNREVP